ncbi:MAG: type II toxin-antitoxin system RelE/ParE family toxin [Planctomycetes bacterium]|nr:type II toxin-antitoxin system RelE/ParE family toxin [Planctomycetota bacterium]
MATIHVTRRALDDIAAIHAYSQRQWGKRTAAGYLAGFDAALQRIAAKPRLLRPWTRGGGLATHGIQKHLLIAEVVGDRIFVLAVWHGSTDVTLRLTELEPQLLWEARLLRSRILESAASKIRHGDLA